jgi:phospholipid transport system substrate-binding protein
LRLGAADADTPAPASEGQRADGAAGATPESVIRGLQAELLDYMQQAGAASADAAQAEASLRAAIHRTHDFPYIARIALGRHWRPLETARREAFVERFTALSLATYLDRFADFEGNAFEITGAGESAFGQHRVEAALVTENGQHAFEYLLRRGEDGSWRIVNIIVDGVSDLALRRAEYARVYEDAGYDGLMDELERQLRALADADD